MGQVWDCKPDQSPDRHAAGKCFDVHSAETLKHDAGGDSQGIASAIKYAISNWGVDPKKVFVTVSCRSIYQGNLLFTFSQGGSSGAMMTQVMAGSYPDLITATSEISGVPFGCFAGSGEWNNACADGQVNKTGAQWVCSVDLLHAGAATEPNYVSRAISSVRRTQDIPGLARE